MCSFSLSSLSSSSSSLSLSHCLYLLFLLFFFIHLFILGEFSVHRPIWDTGFQNRPETATSFSGSSPSLSAPLQLSLSPYLALSPSLFILLALLPFSSSFFPPLSTLTSVLSRSSPSLFLSFSPSYIPLPLSLMLSCSQTIDMFYIGQHVTG